MNGVTDLNGIVKNFVTAEFISKQLDIGVTSFYDDLLHDT